MREELPIESRVKARVGETEKRRRVKTVVMIRGSLFIIESVDK